MAEFLQYAFAGLSNGAIYALIALGWVIIFNVSGVLNLAQGEFLMLGGLTFAWTSTNTGLPMVLDLTIALGAGVVAGVVLDVAVVRRIPTTELVPVILVTLGASIVFRELARMGFGPDAFRHDYFLNDPPIMIKGAALLPESLLLWGVVAVSVVLLGLFFKLTVYGRAMVACSDDPVGAQLIGIDPSRMRTIAFGIAGALAALGGVMIVSLTSMAWDGGTLIGLKGFIAAVLGGLGGYSGAVAGGVALGMLESMAGGYVSSTYHDVFALALLLVLLLLRPQGILRGRLLES